MLLSDPSALVGRDAHTADGKRLGPVEAIFMGRGGAGTEIALVHLGRFGGLARRTVAVPLDGARFEGQDVVLAFREGAVTSAPEVDADAEQLTPDQESQILGHFGTTPT